MLEQALVSGLVGLLTGMIGSFIGFHWWPALRRRRIWKDLRADATHTGLESKPGPE